MILKAFSVRDSKSESFLPPFFANSVGSAVRSFGDAANEKSSMLYKHPGDYQLYELGYFDDNDGVLTALIPMKLLGCAADFVSDANNGSSLQDLHRVAVANGIGNGD